jgi:predicted metalloprotease
VKRSLRRLNIALAAAQVTLVWLSACTTPTEERGGLSPVDVRVQNALADLADYWSSTFPDSFGRAFAPLRGGHFSVDPSDIDPAQYPQGVGCGADPRDVAGTAFYCHNPKEPHSDSISYDRTFLADLVDVYGDFLPDLVMAHEYGHVVQARVGSPPTSIAAETQADCFAGAWTKWVANGRATHARISTPELDDLLRGYLLLRDPVGTPDAAPMAHGSYFDRLSGFYAGFAGGPKACREDWGPSRPFTQSAFTDEEMATGGDLPYVDALQFAEQSLQELWTLLFENLDPSGDVVAPAVQSFHGAAPVCGSITSPDRELAYCATDHTVHFDEELAQPSYDDIGDFAVTEAIALPYGFAVRSQLELSTDNPVATRSAVCLSGWFAAQIYNGRSSVIRISPGDIDEAVLFLLAYGMQENVLPHVGESGFQLVGAFRGGFVEGIRACDVGV